MVTLHVAAGMGAGPEEPSGGRDLSGFTGLWWMVKEAWWVGGRLAGAGNLFRSLSSGQLGLGAGEAWQFSRWGLLT